MAEFVGGFIDPAVITQLEKRADIYKKKTGRTPEDLNFMNSRNAWVRVISSVDVINPVTTPERITFNNTDAKNYVLSNLSSIKGTGDSLSYTANSGIDFNKKNANTAYQYSEETGVRPKPGITSFAVTSKGRFGTIREANVSFAVWSREDLDAVERIYFRPGYSCIIEWGHTVYVDNVGKVQTDLSGFNSNIKDYFDSTKTFNSIQSILSQNTKNKVGNYQSFVGFIKNFNWSFRKDGGYDCSISVISQGEILESLKMNTLDNAGEITPKQEDSKNEKSLIHKFLGEIRSNSKNIITRSEIADKSVKQALRKLPVPVDAPIAIKRSSVDNVTDKRYCYLPLRNLIHLINEGYVLKTENCETIAGINVLSGEEYFTFDNHFSVQPLVCILPKTVKIDNVNLYIVNDDTRKMYNGTVSVSGRENYGKRILDILITDILIERALETAGSNVKDFLNYILSEITKALGSINEFDIEEDSDTLNLVIRDKAIIPDKVTFNAQPNPPIIPLSGIQSLLTDLKIQSKISKDLASMIAIAAQAGPSRSTEDTHMLTQWNAGLEDRFAGRKTQDSCKRETTVDEDVKFGDVFKKIFKEILTINAPALLYFYKSLSELFKESTVAEKAFLTYALEGYRELFTLSEGEFVGDAVYFKNVSYNEKVFDTLLAKAPSYFRERLYGAQIPTKEIKTEQDAVMAKGVIPVELSFTTDGIGGIKIGQAFKVSPGVLPKKYDEFGYIVTGLDHSIENNRWYTSVKSQLFIIPGEAKQGNADIKAPQASSSSNTANPAPVPPVLLDTRPSDGPFMNHLRTAEYNALSPEVRNSLNNKYERTIIIPSENVTTRGLRLSVKNLFQAITDLARVRHPGSELRISSGYRTAAENEQIRGATNSYHLEGMAIDIVPVKGITIQQLAEIAVAVGAGGVGVYDRHVHVDIGTKRPFFTGTSR
jgi:hypothetical protein